MGARRRRGSRGGARRRAPGARLKLRRRRRRVDRPRRAGVHGNRRHGHPRRDLPQPLNHQKSNSTKPQFPFPPPNQLPKFGFRATTNPTNKSTDHPPINQSIKSEQLEGRTKLKLQSTNPARNTSIFGRSNRANSRREGRFCACFLWVRSRGRKGRCEVWISGARGWRRIWVTPR